MIEKHENPYKNVILGQLDSERTGKWRKAEPLSRYKIDIKAPVWFNGVVRGEETVILFNLGETSAGLDVHLYPKSDMEGGSVKLAQGVGGQIAVFPNAMNAEDAGIHTGMHQKRQPGEKRGLLPVQRRLGFQAQGDACGGKNGTGIV